MDTDLSVEKMVKLSIKNVTLLENKFLMNGTLSEDWISNEQVKEVNKVMCEKVSEGERNSSIEDNDEITYEGSDSIELPRRSTRERRRARCVDKYSALALNAKNLVDAVRDSLK